MSTPAADTTEAGLTSCRAITAGGTRCGQAVRGEPWLCIWHDPARREEADLARARGRANQRRPVTSTTEEPEILTDCPDLELTLDHLNFHLAWAVRKCSAGEMDADRLRSISQAITGLRSGLTARELARQVRELNREIKRLKGELAKKAPARESWS